ncbi:unnamed protein product [Bursaphelenchus okinawaensis]|uniref:Grh/CP2 DB domain-containing protein n=1 Tax=Bursaphelenchus okinawaensis TaxID=465554 RepID=A0A811JVQ6_9BILA|nr:unnamed protein product [Bursaphelenchus okinawaensis]CAG9086116.1 unnamed protein product [Bursaphelenchus okinawaensis]
MFCLIFVVESPALNTPHLQIDRSTTTALRLHGAVGTMKFPYDGSNSVITNTVTQFPLNSNSVIKTAPSRNSQHFVTKEEALDMGTLAGDGIQDINKMQPTTMENYPYYNQNMVYDYMNTRLINQNPQLYPFTNASTANILQNDWSQVDNYRFQPQQIQQRTPSSSTIQYQHSHSENGQTHADQRIYKMGGAELLSPVDSGIGTEISVIDGNVIKSEYFSVVQPTPVGQSQGTPVSVDLSSGPLSMERRDTANSHRENSPVVIPKLHNQLGFQYVLETAISTSIRKEDDRMTYVNKSQYYTVTLEYIPDPNRPLKSNTVRSQIMVVFRENKPREEEIKTWQLWHKRQHSGKQRILEVNQKECSGILGPIEEIAHNAIQFCWDPTNNSPQISIAFQCLSTDFSAQKGVKGLPLHVQIDTYDEDSKVPFHRGYCQIKVFCDKGAERKFRDEEKRQQRRKAGGGGRKKSDGEYHEPCERSEFYHMSDLEKQAVLFVPSDDFDSRFLDPTDFDCLDIVEPVVKRPRINTNPERHQPQPAILTEPSRFSVMIYVKKREEDVFTALHLVPPNLCGLYNALYQKYNLDQNKISRVLKKNVNGDTVKMDDDMIAVYSNENTFILEVEPVAEDPSYYTVTLVELRVGNDMGCRTPLTQQWTPQH